MIDCYYERYSPHLKLDFTLVLNNYKENWNIRNGFYIFFILGSCSITSYDPIY